MLKYKNLWSVGYTIFLIIQMISNQGVIHPIDLLNILARTNYDYARFVTPTDQLQQQKVTLCKIIGEYQMRIQQSKISSLQLQKLMALKQHLIVQLQQLRTQRETFDFQFQQRVRAIEMTPIELHDEASIRRELAIYHERSQILKVKLRDLHAYANKLQQQNVMLSEQRLRIDQQKREQATTVAWQEVVHSAKKNIAAEEQQVMLRVKQREQAALRSVQAQELQIQERNRRRRESFNKGRRRHSPMQGLENAYHPAQYQL